LVAKLRFPSGYSLYPIYLFVGVGLAGTPTACLRTQSFKEFNAFNSSCLVPVVTDGLPAYNWSTYNVSNHDDLMNAGYVVVFNDRPTD
jgi:hypothetical protein